MAILAGLPGILVATCWLYGGELAGHDILALSLLIGGLWLGFAFAASNRVLRSLQVLSSLLSSLREYDFSIRARRAHPSDPLGEVLDEINSIGDILSTQRIAATEATALLHTVIQKIDVAVFAFDEHHVLQFANEAGAHLLGVEVDHVVGHTAWDLGLAECLEGGPSRILERRQFPGAFGRWGLRRSTFRTHGVPNTLIVLGDLSRALREEEVRAWQNIVRVLGHELNNSLSPIKSISGSLRERIMSSPPEDELTQDLKRGLEIIEGRAEGLCAFVAAYAQLAKLPQPNRKPTEVRALIERVVAMEPRLSIQVERGPELIMEMDASQIEQALINLVKNAVEAALERQAAEKGFTPEVRLSWNVHQNRLEIRIEDNGPGITNPDNLFTPYFSTKSGGSGIGLVLCRQIIENHEGSVSLSSHQEGNFQGTIARVQFPL